ncbi:RidA family protein [Nocardioides ginsengisoli]|uniref:RidA family protein n=1 Tax=Nocardioides ginsengisoli TaxID=363868 RepID=A0ABW3W7T3_9ACTN
MSISIISTPDAPAPSGAYSQAVVANGLVYTGGMAPIDMASGELVTGDAAAETRLVMENLAVVLKAAGSSLDHVMKATVHLHELDRDWATFDAAFKEFFPKGAPARTTVGSKLGGFLVEIDLVAVAPGDDGDLARVSDSQR